jgi:hypothetical protein
LPWFGVWVGGGVVLQRTSFYRGAHRILSRAEMWSCSIKEYHHILQHYKMVHHYMVSESMKDVRQAVHMALHPRLGKGSPLQQLDSDTLHAIMSGIEAEAEAEAKNSFTNKVYLDEKKDIFHLNGYLRESNDATRTFAEVKSNVGVLQAQHDEVPMEDTFRREYFADMLSTLHAFINKVEFIAAKGPVAGEHYDTWNPDDSDVE